MAKRFLVIGLGRFGTALVESLEDQGCEVIAVDRDMAHVERVKEKAAFAVQLDATTPEGLKPVDPHSCEMAIVAIGEDFESACLAVSSLKELGVTRILARAQTPRRGRILLNAGATEMMQVETEMGMRLGERLAREAASPAADKSGTGTTG